MFHQARLRLTILYSMIFLVLFWSLSSGVYLWMNHYLGDSSEKQSGYAHAHQSEAPGDIIMDQLRDVLFLLDFIMLIAIPVITWFLTGRTLAPVQTAHEREKQFLTNASHDLRTPLAILSAEMEVALHKKRTIYEYIQTLHSNKEEVDDLSALVENLLFIDNNQHPYMHDEDIDLTDLLAERMGYFQQQVKQKQLKLLFEPPAESIIIKGNRQLFKRLFTNLLDNAIKYTPSKGYIKVRLKKEKESVQISMTDNGIGILPDQQEKVFDRFYRADSSRTEKGYGLGLSISKQIVEYYQGSIKLQSVVGKGTTFIITFPAIR